MGIAELRGFVAQSGEVFADLDAEPVGAKRQPDRRAGVGLRKTGGSVENSGRSGGREANKVSAIHGSDCITGDRRAQSVWRDEKNHQPQRTRRYTKEMRAHEFPW